MKSQSVSAAGYSLAFSKVKGMQTFSSLKILELRFEAFNAFNHGQFYGAKSLNGNIDSPAFGRVTQAASPRIVQLGRS
jgi:hypothetical protein